MWRARGWWPGQTRGRSVDRNLLSGDYPFHRLDAATIAGFLQTLPDHGDQEKIAHANAETLYGPQLSPTGPGNQAE
jgi:hypothetical protein